MKIVLLAREANPVKQVRQMYERWAAELLPLGVECTVQYARDYAEADEILSSGEIVDLVVVRELCGSRVEEACVFIRKVAGRFANRIIGITAQRNYERPMREAGATDFVCLVGAANPLLDLVTVFRRPAT